MTLISLLMSWAALQLWNCSAWLQRDSWFFSWQARLQRCSRLSKVSGGVLFVSLVGPLLLLAMTIVALIVWVSPLAVIIVNVAVLIYSFGRVDLKAQVAAYLQAWHRDDSSAAVHILLQLDDQLPSETLLGDAVSWQELHVQALKTFAYAGFERIFAVLFWFMLLGAVGAFLYRLSSLYLNRIDIASDEYALAAKWLWLLEWPAVRVMGLSWAMVGNFVGCFNLWREHLFCSRQSSSQLLLSSVQGALGLDVVEPKSPETDSSVVCTQVGCSGHQVEALQGLLSRSLLLWISVLALLTLFG